MDNYETRRQEIANKYAVERETLQNRISYLEKYAPPETPFELIIANAMGYGSLSDVPFSAPISYRQTREEGDLQIDALIEENNRRLSLIFR